MNTNRMDAQNGTIWTRRQMLAAAGAAAGAVAVARQAQGAAPDEGPPSRTVVRVAAVSYTMPFHDHRAAGVNLQPLRDMTAQVARERPDFICYPEICCSTGRCGTALRSSWPTGPKARLST